MLLNIILTMLYPERFHQNCQTDNKQLLHGLLVDSADYYTSREDTLIPLDECHVSKLLATCASAGSLTAVTIRRISTRCQGDDVLAPVVKVPFHDSLYC